MKVSDYIAKLLGDLEIHYAYGCVGGAVTHIVDSIFKEGRTAFIHSYHEQAAAFSASAAAKYTGKMHVAIATSGPGATNMITGIADAFFDSAPVLFITGQVNTYDFKYQKKLRQFGFQETDIVRIVKPITKRSILLDKPDFIEESLLEAIRIVNTGRKGPVLVDIPMDVQKSEITPTLTKFNENMWKDDGKKVSSHALNEFIFELEQAEYPLILAGGGCNNQKIRRDLLAASEKTSIPTAVTLLGKDCFPNDHELFAGFVGAYGNRYANIALTKCDLLLVFGARLDSRQVGNVITPFKGKKILQIDIDPNEKEGRIPDKLFIQADLRIAIAQILKEIEKKGIYLRNERWLTYLQKLKNTFLPESEPIRANVENFHYKVASEISKNMRAGDVVCVDIGQNQIVAAQTFIIRNCQRFITSGGIAPMGYALPAAIGVCKERSQRTLVISGDGGMQLNIHELNTVAKQKLPILIFVFNNRSLGMIKQFQALYFKSHYCDTDENCGYYSIDFVKIAEAYGIPATKIVRQNDWKTEIKGAMADETPLPFLIEINLDFPTYVYPKLEYDKPLDMIDPPTTKEEDRIIGGIKSELQQRVK